MGLDAPPAGLHETRRGTFPMARLACHEESPSFRICWVYPSFGRQKLWRMSDQSMLISWSCCFTQVTSGGLLFTSISSMLAISVSSLFTSTSTILVVSDPGSEWLLGRSGRKRNGASEGSLAVSN